MTMSELISGWGNGGNRVPMTMSELISDWGNGGIGYL